MARYDKAISRDLADMPSKELTSLSNALSSQFRKGWIARHRCSGSIVLDGPVDPTSYYVVCHLLPAKTHVLATRSTSVSDSSTFPMIVNKDWNASSASSSSSVFTCRRLSQSAQTALSGEFICRPCQQTLHVEPVEPTYLLQSDLGFSQNRFGLIQRFGLDVYGC